MKRSLRSLLPANSGPPDVFAEGNFAFDDVPLGAYGIAVKSGRKWQITLSAALGTQMTEGATYDIGSLELK